MIAAGVNAKALSSFMGHASITVTFERYGHLMPGTEAEGAALLDAFLDGFSAVLAARWTPGVPSTALHHVAGASPVGARAFSEALAVGAILRTVP